MGNSSGIAILDNGIFQDSFKKLSQNNNYIYSLLKLKNIHNYIHIKNPKIHLNHTYSKDHGTAVVSAFALKSPHILKHYGLDQNIAIYNYPFCFEEIDGENLTVNDLTSYEESAIESAFKHILEKAYPQIKVINLSYGCSIFSQLGIIDYDSNPDFSKIIPDIHAYYEGFHKSSSVILKQLKKLRQQNIILIQAAGNYDLDLYDINNGFDSLVNQNNQSILVGGINNEADGESFTTFTFIFRKTAINLYL